MLSEDIQPSQQLRLSFSVKSLVPEEVRCACKRLATLIALVRFFSSVNPFVFNEGGAFSEGLPTIAARIGLFSSVNPLVCKKVVGAGE